MCYFIVIYKELCIIMLDKVCNNCKYWNSDISFDGISRIYLCDKDSLAGRECYTLWDFTCDNFNQYVKKCYLCDKSDDHSFLKLNNRRTTIDVCEECFGTSGIKMMRNQNYKIISL